MAEENKLLESIVELKNKIKKERSEFYAGLDMLDDYYAGERDPARTSKDDPDVNPNKVFSEVETLKGKMADSILSAPRIVQANATEISKSEAVVELNRQIDRVVRYSSLKTTLRASLQDFILKGLLTLQAIYDKKDNCFKLRNINPGNVFWDLDAEDFSNIRYVITEGSLSTRELLAEIEAGLLEIKDQEYLKKLRDKDAVNAFTRDIPFIEMWTKDHVYTVVDGKYLAREAENELGFIPIVLIPNYALECKPFGDIDPMLPMIEAQIDNFNMMYDNNRIKNKRFGFYKTGALSPDFKIRNGGLFPVTPGNNPKEAIYFPEIPDISNGSQFLEGIFRSVMQDISAQYDYSRGKEGKRQEFATTVITLVNNANTRVNMRLLVMSAFLGPFFKKMIKFMVESGSDIKLDPAEIFNADIILNGENTGEAARMARADQVGKMVQLISMIPQAADALEGRKLAEKIIELYGNSPAEYLKTDEEMAKIAAEQAAAAPPAGADGAGSQVPGNLLSQIAGAQGGLNTMEG